MISKNKPFGFAPKNDAVKVAKNHSLVDLFLKYSTSKLLKFGKNYKGLCPFHKEDTPSFIIYTETNTFHCFGCRVSGDSISFYQKVNNCSFNEAVKAL